MWRSRFCWCWFGFDRGLRVGREGGFIGTHKHGEQNTSLSRARKSEGTKSEPHQQQQQWLEHSNKVHTLTHTHTHSLTHTHMAPG